jgi:hypothetical protein
MTDKSPHVIQGKEAQMNDRNPQRSLGFKPENPTVRR